jgi:hypothetical protein
VSVGRRAVALTGVLGVLVASGCGRSGVEWPAGTGYVSPPQNRPASAHEVEQTTSVLEFAGFILGDPAFTGDVLSPEGKSILVFPGAQISHHVAQYATVELKDYNGDVCIVPLGMTVRVDEYGQFVPLKYEPMEPFTPTP